MQTKILAALREANDYLSGEALSEQFGITRSAVWKHITKLKSEGYVIDSIRNRGYKLLSAPDILDADTISKALA
ncbi:MAG TPA: biotin--[acetyl-CoA-carboxylase] ligase, partial [Ruminococcaceae bacterium]|nr:biotin--[acetyl-CoA-carboxylase] ligase [Oscillospiraceae bacterium]